MANLEEHFNFLKSIKKDEYSLELQPVTINQGEYLIQAGITNGLVINKEISPNFRLEEESGSQFWIVPKEALELYHPDNIDSREFWKKSTEVFPYFSIAGGPHDINSPEQVNESTFNFQKNLGVLDWLNESIHADSKILEIGPGYGMVYEKMIKNYANLEKNYYSLDVNPLFWHDNMYIGDGQTIPEGIPDELDIVYSINVFQHLSKKQRESYYKQVHDKLKIGGRFIVGTYCVTPNNIQKPLWGHRDEQGNFYTVFLGQYTEIEHLNPWFESMVNVGYKIIRAVECVNYVSVELEKI